MSKNRNEQREKANKEDRQQKTPACRFRNAKYPKFLNVKN
jgi:hypothetical protein